MKPSPNSPRSSTNVEDLTPEDLVWPKPYNATFTPPRGGKYEKNKFLSSGWGKIGVINPRQIRMVYAKRLHNLGLIHLVNQAFDRLKTSLSMYDSDDVPYTRMHFKPLRKNNDNSISVQATSLPAGHDTVISINILKPLGPDESYIPTDNTVDESYSLSIDRTDMSLKNRYERC